MMGSGRRLSCMDMYSSCLPTKFVMSQVNCCVVMILFMVVPMSYLMAGKEAGEAEADGEA